MPADKSDGISIDENILYRFARNSAKEMKREGTTNASNVVRMISKCAYNMQKAYKAAQEFSMNSPKTPAEMEWLIDNFYLYEKAAKESIRDLKNAKKLPCSNGNTDDPYIFRLAMCFVSLCKCEITPKRTRAFLEGALTGTCLKESELYHFIPFVKGALIIEGAKKAGEIIRMAAGYKKSADEKDPFSCEAFIWRALKTKAEIPEGYFAMREKAQDIHRKNAELFKNMFSAFRILDDDIFEDIIREINPVDRILSEDPAGIYKNMSDETKRRYRRRLSEIAKKEKISETDAAKKVVSLAEKDGDGAHVGRYIMRMSRGHVRGFIYFGSIAIMTFAISMLSAALFESAWMFLAALLPASEIAKNTVDSFALRFVKPAHIPRLEFEGGIPKEGKTLCVISALVTDPEKAKETVKLLDRYRRANRDFGKNLLFGVLADLKDSQNKEEASDGEILNAASETISGLNKNWGGGYFLFSRKRVQYKRDGVFMGWERKRGAIMELARYLRGKDSGIKVFAGDQKKLNEIKYIITLDSDTRLLAGSAKKLISAMMHPLNKPEIDKKRNVVVRGHGILQPRISTELESASRSAFSKLFSGIGGIDPYSSAMSDVYQDVFSQGIFTGKAAIDIDALLTVLDGRLPEGRILSHDLLEGAYLRSALIGDVELCDGTPYKVSAYFDRLHRWIRGDFQISSWLFGKVPTLSGREKNPIGGIRKWQIFDNMRRAVLPSGVIAVIAAGLSKGGVFLLVSGIIAILTIAFPILTDIANEIFRVKKRRSRYLSRVATGPLADVMRFAVMLSFLPYQAWVGLDAALRSIFRVFVSKKNLLSWVTADMAEKLGGTKPAFYYRKMIVCPIAAVLAIVFAYPGGIVPALFWVVAPAVAGIISRPLKKTTELARKDREFIVSNARAIWRYFEDFLSEEDNFLPPDNFQEYPPSGLAHRTSPTNIGMALISVLSARDFGFIDDAQAIDIISKTMDSVEKLERYGGHLLNWYDTKTLKALKPRFVSSVDNGNLAACLVALENGLSEMTCDSARALSKRIRAIADSMDFGKLYNSKKGLLYISYDAEKGKPGSGVYDLMASEAMLTSYFAVARGDIPKKHWEKLSRALSSKDGYKGMLSWTGSMFEYLMPALLLPMPGNSLIYESARFALYCQNKKAKEKNVPMGISESAFFAFDNEMNYQYKAHGVQRLGLKRGLDKEIVVSPYSAFLALGAGEKCAISALRDFHKMGLFGKYGFYEAADFTKDRIPHGEKFAPVKCYMAHHIGMSMISAANSAFSGVMIKRFMNDPDMKAFYELLCEKIPVDAPVMKIPQIKIPDRPQAPKNDEYPKRIIRGCNIEKPEINLMRDGMYNLVMTDAGISFSQYGNISLTRTEGELFSPDMGGIYFFAHCDGKIRSLYPAPFYDKTAEYASEYYSDCCVTAMKTPEMETEIETYLSTGEETEIRTVKVKNITDTEKTIDICAYLEPVLSDMRDYRAHRAFSKLFMNAKIAERGAIITRRGRDGEKERSMAFACSENGARFSVSREKLLGRGGVLSIEKAADSEEIPGDEGDVIDPCIFAKTSIKVPAGKEARVKFALSFSEDGPDEAYCAAQRAIIRPETDRADVSKDAAKMFALGRGDIEDAFRLYSHLLFPGDDAARTTEAPFANKILWRFGISDDLPIIAVKADNENDDFSAILRKYMFLRTCGAKIELVFIVPDAGEYRRPVKSAISEMLCRAGAESILGERGGIHIADIPDEDTEAREKLMLLSGCVIGNKNERDAGYKCAPENMDLISTWKHAGIEDNGEFYEGFDENNDFTMRIRSKLPQRVRGHILCNRGFGYIATETGCGYMWSWNSRENKINEWKNDPVAVDGPEAIRIKIGDKEGSVFADARGDCDVRYSLGIAEYKKRIGKTEVKTTVFVDKKYPARIVLIELCGENAENAEVTYHNALTMGDGMHKIRLNTFYDEDTGALCAENPENEDFYPCIFATMTDDKIEDFSFSRFSYAKKAHDRKTGLYERPVVSAKIKPQKMPDGRFILTIVSAAVSDRKALKNIKKLANAEIALSKMEDTCRYWKKLCLPVEIQNMDDALCHYINGWALYQVLTCRIFSRTSIYQAGGAYGFRDQLQDVCAVSNAMDIAGHHIIRSCMHQFEEGDVQHWWHYTKTPRASGHRGVRTRCSDDLLWLPHALCEYVKRTGDRALCDVEVPYIKSKPLSEGECDRYEIPAISDLKESVYLHACRACEKAIERGTGKHGLARILGGDWNDGMNKVGMKGDGESVWLSFFISTVLSEMADLSFSRGDNTRAERYKSISDEYRKNAENAFEKGQYIRGYYDDGAHLGSPGDDCCEIDSIAQSFAVFAGADIEKSTSAVRKAIDELFDEDELIVKLFRPPFDEYSKKDPGYIKAYPPGVRENGGQYTHAAIWLAIAAMMCGLEDEGYAMMEAMLPEKHKNSVYEAELYLMPADIYASKGSVGRAGWSGYTGAAGWYYRAAVETMLGIRIENGKMRIKPALPERIRGYSAKIRIKGEYSVKVVIGEENEILVDGEKIDGDHIKLEEGEHDVLCKIAGPRTI